MHCFLIRLICRVTLLIVSYLLMLCSLPLIPTSSMTILCSLFNMELSRIPIVSPLFFLTRNFLDISFPSMALTSFNMRISQNFLLECQILISKLYKTISNLTCYKLNSSAPYQLLFLCVLLNFSFREPMLNYST